MEVMTPEQVTDELDRRKHIRFMERCWNDEANPFIAGLHTKMICDRLDKALEDFQKGKSTYLRISVHQRAGKSEMVSVFLPPRFLALFPGLNTMAVSYNTGKAAEASGKAQRLVTEEPFRELFPEYTMGRRAAGRWSLAKGDVKTKGEIYSAGLFAGLTGRGFSLGIVDDYCKNRQQAESLTMRNRMWDAFTNDFLTRQAPVTIVVVLATWWHEDDIHGRIEKRNDPRKPEYDPEFPVFEHLAFPARKDMAPPELRDKYKNEYLFQERYSSQWYEGQYAFLGAYSAAAMMNCNPTPRGGAILNTENIQWHNTLEDFPEDLEWIRVWDLAHTAKQRIGDDPDYTGGTLIAFREIGYVPGTSEPIWEAWVRHYVQFQEKATARDAQIKKYALTIDGEYVEIVIESSLDAKDAGDYIQTALMGIRSVTNINMGKQDKVVRCTPVEPMFEAGNVHVLKGPWNHVWLDGMTRFDGSGTTHDEMVDNFTAGYKHACLSPGYEELSEEW